MNREINPQQEKKYIAIKASPLVSIITLNWNQTETTTQFLESTRKLTYKNFEVIVCDMGSATDPGPQIFKGNYPNTRLLQADITLKSSGAAKWAVTQAKGDFILFMNNQTEVTENLVEELLTPLLEDSALGVTCPKIYSYRNKNIIEYAGCKPVNVLTGKSNIVGHREKDKGQYDKKAYTSGVFSGAMMIRRNVIEKGGVLSQNFFVYFDDTEISNRILKTGYKILYQPKAIVYSKYSVANKRKTAMEVYYNTRNRILAMRNNTSAVHFVAFLIFCSLFYIPANIIRFTATWQFGHLKAFFKAITWNLKKRKSKLAFYSNL